MNHHAFRERMAEPVEKLTFFGLTKNAQMQGARNPESGVATNKERLFATPPRW